VKVSTRPLGCGHLISSLSILARLPMPRLRVDRVKKDSFHRHFQAAALEIACLPGEFLRDASGLAFLADQTYAEPMIPGAATFFSSTGAPPSLPTSTSTAPSLLKSPMPFRGPANVWEKAGPRGGAHIFQSAAAVVAKEEQRLFVHYVTGMLFDFIVGMAVGDEEVDVASLS